MNAVRAFVTGGTGFAGGAILRHLLAKGFEVHALARDEAGAGALEAEGARVFRGGLGDPASIAAAAASCEVAFHAAGSPSFRAAPDVLGWLNVAGTENVLRAARHAGVRRLVHVSCCDVTMTSAPRVRWDEDKAPVGAPADAHARSKLEAEELVIGLCAPAAFETTVVRPAFLWGAGDHTNLPALCREGLRGGIRLVGKGSNLMATTHVRNLADAAVRAATAPNAAGAVYIACDSELTLQSEFFAALSKAAGLPPPRPGLPYPLALAGALVRGALGAEGLHPTEVRRRGASSSFEWRKAKSELGYESPVSHEEGMRELAAWVAAEGGASAIAGRERPTPTRRDVATQIESARAATA